MNKNEVKEYWKQRALTDSIDIDRKDFFWDNFEKNLVLSVLKEQDKNVKILDLGCGTGRLSRFIQDIGYTRIYSIDNVQECVDATKRVMSNSYVSLMDATKLKFQDEYFDFIISCRTLQSLQSKEEKIQAMEEISRVAKEESYLLLIEGNPKRFTPTPKHNQYLHLSEWNEILDKSGYEIKSRVGIPLSTILSEIDKKDRKIMRNYSHIYSKTYELDQILGVINPEYATHEFGIVANKRRDRSKAGYRREEDIPDTYTWK